MNWTLIITVIATAAVVVTAWIYHRQLKAMTKTRQLDSILVILRYIDDFELRRVRYFIYEHGENLKSVFDKPFSWENRKLIDEEVKRLSGETVELHKIELWINALNNICFLVREGYAPSEVVSGFMRNALPHCWYVFAPYIEHRRTRVDTIGEPSVYAGHLQWVVENRCKSKTLQGSLKRNTKEA